jgi:hypothetical protein
MDAVFIASGHRPVRLWSGASLVLTNSIVLAMPGFGGFTSLGQAFRALVHGAGVEVAGGVQAEFAGDN